MDAADQVPGRIATFQKILDVQFGFCQLRRERCVQFLPEIFQNAGIQVFRARHGRRGKIDAFEVDVGRSWDWLARLLRAERRDEASAEIAPVSVSGRQRCRGFFGAQQEKTVSGSTFERALQAIQKSGFERQRVRIWSEYQAAVRSER